MKEVHSNRYKQSTRIRELIDIPVIILITAAVFIWLILISFGEHPVRMNPDTDTYRYFDFSSMHAMLSSIRTIAYPVLLRVIWVNTGSVDALPAIQLSFFLLGIFLYFFAIRKYTASSWVALFAALPILNTRFLFQHYDVMSSDALGCAMMICTLSFTILCAADKKNIALLALGLSLFLTYQVRPAYLFLVILAPCIYFVLRTIKKDHTDIGKGLLNVSAVCILPLIAFCLLRLIIIGQFGLVSFGGYNITGVTSSLIYPKVIDSLAEENRDIANDIYSHRLIMGHKSIQEKIADNGPRIYLSWRDEYKDNIYKFSVPAVKKYAELNKEIANTPYVNEKLTRLAREIIIMEPVYYFKWVAFQIIYGTYRIVFDLRQNFWLGCLLVMAVAIRIFRKVTGNIVPIPAPTHGPAIIAGGCLFSGLILVALVEPALYRYAQPVGIFIPGAFLVYIFASLTNQSGNAVHQSAAC